MARKRSRVGDYAVYLIIRVIICVLQMLPYERSLALGNGLAWLLYQLDRRHRRVAHENLQSAFPEMTDANQRDELIRAVYRHFCGLVITLLYLPRKLHASNWKQYIRLTRGRELLSLLLSGKPLWLVTGHFGNWELGGYFLGVVGFSTHAIARTLDNPYLEKYLKDFRQRTGQTILSKNDDFHRIQTSLDQGGIIATLGDQDAGQKGLYVDFFGRPASTHKAIALMALQQNITMVVIAIPKVGEPMRHVIDVRDVIDPQEYAGRPDAVKVMTQRFTLALEQAVREYPEQYLWLHRRWKHQPKARGNQAA